MIVSTLQHNICASILCTYFPHNFSIKKHIFFSLNDLMSSVILRIFYMYLSHENLKTHSMCIQCRKNSGPFQIKWWGKILGTNAIHWPLLLSPWLWQESQEAASHQVLDGPSRTPAQAAALESHHHSNGPSPQPPSQPPMVPNNIYSSFRGERTQ